jgi:hypothetical protein
MMYSGCGLRGVTSKSAFIVFAAAIGAAIICDAHPSLHDVQQDRFGHDALASATQPERRDSYGGARAECWARSKARIDVYPCLQEKLAETERDYEKIAARLAAKLAELDAVT